MGTRATPGKHCLHLQGHALSCLFSFTGGQRTPCSRRTSALEAVLLSAIPVKRTAAASDLLVLLGVHVWVQARSSATCLNRMSLRTQCSISSCRLVWPQSTNLAIHKLAVPFGSQRAAAEGCSPPPQQSKTRLQHQAG